MTFSYTKAYKVTIYIYIYIYIYKFICLYVYIHQQIVTDDKIAHYLYATHSFVIFTLVKLRYSFGTAFPFLIFQNTAK